MLLLGETHLGTMHWSSGQLALLLPERYHLCDKLSPDFNGHGHLLGPGCFIDVFSYWKLMLVACRMFMWGAMPGHQLPAFPEPVHQHSSQYGKAATKSADLCLVTFLPEADALPPVSSN